MGYQFKQIVKSVKKMRPEADDSGPFLRVTLDNSHRIKIPLDGSEDKKVVSHLRKGVQVEGTFDSIHGWTPEGQRFAQVHTLINADINKVSKGSYTEADVEEGIETIDWDKVDATVQASYAQPETPTETGKGPDMSALAAALGKGPQQ